MAMLYFSFSHKEKKLSFSFTVKQINNGYDKTIFYICLFYSRKHVINFGKNSINIKNVEG